MSEKTETTTKKTVVSGWHEGRKYFMPRMNTRRLQPARMIPGPPMKHPGIVFQRSPQQLIGYENKL
jgi:hypothetical protein